MSEIFVLKFRLLIEMLVGLGETGQIDSSLAAHKINEQVTNWLQVSKLCLNNNHVKALLNRII